MYKMFWLYLEAYVRRLNCEQYEYHIHVNVHNTWQFNSAKTIFAFSCLPQLRRKAKLFVSCCRPYLIHQNTTLLFPNLHLPGEIFTCKGVKSYGISRILRDSMKSYGILSNPNEFHRILRDSMNPKGLLLKSPRTYHPIGFYYESLRIH